jgi:hypothetical protein
VIALYSRYEQNTTKIPHKYRGGRGRFTQKKGVMLHPQATDF